MIDDDELKRENLDGNNKYYEYILNGEHFVSPDQSLTWSLSRHD